MSLDMWFPTSPKSEYFRGRNRGLYGKKIQKWELSSNRLLQRAFLDGYKDGYEIFQARLKLKEARNADQN